MCYMIVAEACVSNSFFSCWFGLLHLALHSAHIKEQVNHAFGFPNDYPIQVSSIISDAVLLCDCVRAAHYWNFKLFSIVQFTLYDLLKICPVTSWRGPINICCPCHVLVALDRIAVRDNTNELLQ
jgi:hypothetical protein